MVTSKNTINELIEAINALIQLMLDAEKSHAPDIARVDPKHRQGARNLVHYRAMRSKDLTSLQRKLRNMGLSRLGKAEAHVLPSLEATKDILQRLNGRPKTPFESVELPIRDSRRRHKRNVAALLGKKPKRRRSRIMVTMPDDVAFNSQLLRDMLRHGMNIARINCAHGSEQLWSEMIKNIRAASQDLDIPCKIAMDLAGPKIRTGPVESNSGVLKVRPRKNVRGKYVDQALIWMGLANTEGSKHFLPCLETHAFPDHGKIYVRDTRNKARTIKIVDKRPDGCWASVAKTTYFATGMVLYFEKELIHPVGSVGELPPVSGSIVLVPGNVLRLTSKPITAVHRPTGVADDLPIPIHCTNAEVISRLKTGEAVMFDDGKFQGEIVERHKGFVDIRITQVRGQSAKLRADKGINFPDSSLKISGLTDKDKSDLPFILKHADIVNLSFVNSCADVEEFHEALKELTTDSKKIGVVLKIETRASYRNLTDILLSAMRIYPLGVMIARGDLAMEVGWEEVGSIQTEMLKMCHAALVPDIWATQVFESLAKTGVPSRAEITDVWVAQRSECIMLNKGPYIVDAIDMLGIIVTKMNRHQDRDRGTFPSMRASGTR